MKDFGIWLLYRSWLPSRLIDLPLKATEPSRRSTEPTSKIDGDLPDEKEPPPPKSVLRVAIPYISFELILAPLNPKNKWLKILSYGLILSFGSLKKKMRTEYFCRYFTEEITPIHQRKPIWESWEQLVLKFQEIGKSDI